MSDAHKTAIVTGASRGIDAAVAERLAQDGFAVVVNYAGDVAPAEALVGKIKAAGGRATSVRADVSDPAAVASIRHGRSGLRRRRGAGEQCRPHASEIHRRQ